MKWEIWGQEGIVGLLKCFLKIFKIFKCFLKIFKMRDLRTGGYCGASQVSQTVKPSAPHLAGITNSEDIDWWQIWLSKQYSCAKFSKNTLASNFESLTVFLLELLTTEYFSCSSFFIMSSHDKFTMCVVFLWFMLFWRNIRLGGCGVRWFRQCPKVNIFFMMMSSLIQTF